MCELYGKEWHSEDVLATRFIPSSRLEGQAGQSAAMRVIFSTFFFHSFLLWGVVCLWSAICFKIMTRYTCGYFPRMLAIIPATRYTCVFLPRILAFFPALWGFYFQDMTIFLQTRIYMRTKKPIYMRYKQACVYGVTESRHITDTELYRQQKTPSCTMELKSNFSLNSAWPQWPRLSRARFGSYSLPSQ